MPNSEDSTFTASSYPTRLVWLLSLLSLYTTLIMVIIVRWTMIDIRTEREKLDETKSTFTAIRTKLIADLDKEKWDLSTLLAGKEVGTSHQKTEIFGLIDEYRQSTQNLKIEPTFEELENNIFKLYHLRQDCQMWRKKFAEVSADLPVLQHQAEQIIARMEQVLWQAEEQLRSDLTAKIYKFRQSSGLEAEKLALILADDFSASESFATIRRDLNELTLLYERLRGTEESHILKELKDKKFRVTLDKIEQHTRLVSDRDAGPKQKINSLLAELETLLFGEGFSIVNDEIVYIAGGGKLYELTLDNVKLNNQREKLHGEVTRIFDNIHGVTEHIAAKTEAYTKQETVKVETSLRTAWQIILIVGIATAVIFLFISYKIIQEIKAQIKAIEDTNIKLDKQTKALIKSEQALQQSESRLQDLSSSLLSAQENERRRISLELHDELGQSMAALKLQVGSIERKMGTIAPEVLKAECQIIRQYINEIIENVRRLSRDLSPVALDDLGLEAAIDYLASNFAKHTSINTSLETTDINHLFSQDSQRLIYRILQEALTNISKHAQAKNIDIIITKKENLVTFSVKDDGIGFDVDEVINRNPAEKGMGLTTMAERVRILGGSIYFRSRKHGEGTSITFTAPT